MNVSDELKEKAISLGLCTPWQKRWQNEDKHSLCQMYIKGLDFCIDHDYPSCTYMKKHFDGIMQQHGIFVDDVVNTSNLQEVVCNGCCVGMIVYDDFGTGTVYARHQSNVSIKASGHARVFVKVYDHANVNVVCSGNAPATVICHGGNINSTGNVKIVKCND